ncbi:MAG: c-type cytochrome, partial [Blastocatellia bacterium]
MFDKRLPAFMVLILTAGVLTVSGFVSGPAGSNSVTFSKDVASIFFRKCTACHRPGEAAPMSLLTYRDARPWARSIKEKVLTKAMPPWHADPAYGKFENDRSLSPNEIETISRWVDAGAPEGDSKDLPPAPHYTEGWIIGKPDAVFTMPVKFDVPAQGVVDYQYFAVPTNFTEDKWVQAAEVRPGNAAVVHHVIVFIQPPGAAKKNMQAGDIDP